MKTLSEYVEAKQTALFDKYGAFFAFNSKQFDEQKKEGLTYTHLGAGLIAPKGCAKALFEELEQIHKEGIAQDLEENDKQAIIERELNNYECYYTYDVSDCVDALEDYGITTDEILSVFREHSQG